MKTLFFSITLNEALMETFVPIFICVVLPVAIVWIVSHYRRLATERKAEVMLKAIESGTPVDPEFFKPVKKAQSIKEKLLERLNGACITGLMGAAFLIISWVFPGANFVVPATLLPVAGAVMLAIGIGLLIVYFVGKKMLAKEIEAEEKKLNE
jgi:hypothetical protein